MIGIVLVSHGNFAQGLLDAAQLITGEQEQIKCIGLQMTDDTDELVECIQSAVMEVDDPKGVLLMVDLLGGSPFNASGRVALGLKDHLEVITGMNLPMLVELLARREGLDLDKAAQIALETGKSGICLLSDTIK